MYPEQSRPWVFCLLKAKCPGWGRVAGRDSGSAGRPRFPVHRLSQRLQYGRPLVQDHWPAVLRRLSSGAWGRNPDLGALAGGGDHAGVLAAVSPEHACAVDEPINLVGGRPVAAEPVADGVPFGDPMARPVVRWNLYSIRHERHDWLWKPIESSTVSTSSLATGLLAARAPFTRTHQRPGIDEGRTSASAVKASSQA
jgi:hypothetical protein